MNKAEFFDYLRGKFGGHLTQKQVDEANAYLRKYSVESTTAHDDNDMHASDKGLALIKRFEGCRLTAYYDSVGVLTIGYGHTSIAGSPHVTTGMTITQQEADDILRKDLIKYENAVKKLVTVSLTQNQFDALVSFTYNLGAGNLAKSSVLRYTNKRQFATAGRKFILWNKAGGRVLRGLTRRRNAESELFLA